MTSAFSWQNSISLCPASFCIPRPNLLVTPGVSFAFQSPKMKRTSFGGVSSRRSVQYEKTKDRTLKYELPRSVGAQYATGDQWRNNFRKNEGMDPK